MSFFNTLLYFLLLSRLYEKASDTAEKPVVSVIVDVCGKYVTFRMKIKK